MMVLRSDARKGRLARATRAMLVTLAAVCVVPRAARATEVDLNGAWQLETDCGGSPKDTRFVSISESTATGVFTMAITDCGVSDISGVDHPYASCDTVPAATPIGGQVTGSSFASPASGSVRIDNVYATPFSLFCAKPVQHGLFNQALSGTVAADLSISGSQQLTNLTFVDVDGSSCFSLPSFGCTFLLRRTDLPATCTIDGIRSAYEECDDGNAVDDATCDSNCTLPRCGNGIRDLGRGEECDDGNTTNDDTCDNNCTVPACGNHVVDPSRGEECDDGNHVGGDGCDVSCRFERLDLTGNWQLDLDCGELQTSRSLQLVETHATGAVAVTNNDCGQTLTESDGQSHAIASCDTVPPSGVIAAQNDGFSLRFPASGNLTEDWIYSVPFPALGCTSGLARSRQTYAATLNELADHSLGGSVSFAAVDLFQPDGGNCLHLTGGFCTALLRTEDAPATCQIDGTRSAYEDCDDGDTIDGDGCDHNCTATGCGNGVTTVGEECDDHNATDDDTCDSNCTIPDCGNQIVDPSRGEQCDDGNTDDFDGCSATCQLEKLNLAGSWQLTADCAGTVATNSITIDQPDVNTGDFLVTQECDGTTVWDGTIHPWATCSSTPAPFAGHVSGNEILLPPSGAVGLELTFASPFLSSSCPAPRLMAEIQSSVAFDLTATHGTVAGLDRAVGSYRLLGVDIFDSAHASCFSLPSFGLTCSVVMRRNLVEAGQNKTVSPLDGAAITFGDVSTPGRVNVTRLTTAAGEVPANFAVSDTPIFYDVDATTTQFSGGVRVCLPYTETAGLVDETDPPLPEAELRLLHLENGAFVDRTTAGYPDTGANVICADTSSLSPFVFARDVAAANAEPITGKTMLLTGKAGDPAKRRLKLLSKDVAIDLGAGFDGVDDPVLHGATLRLASSSGTPFDVTITLPASQWRYIGSGTKRKGYTFKGTGGPIGRMVVKGGKGAQILVVGGGSDLPDALTASPDPVYAAFTTGTKRSCMSFGGTATFSEGKKYGAKDAPAPASCDF